jgi:hypothetical protein
LNFLICHANATQIQMNIPPTSLGDEKRSFSQSSYMCTTEYLHLSDKFINFSRKFINQPCNICLYSSLTPQRLDIVSNLLLSQIAFRWTISVSHILVSLCFRKNNREFINLKYALYCCIYIWEKSGGRASQRLSDFNLVNFGKERFSGKLVFLPKYWPKLCNGEQFSLSREIFFREVLFQNFKSEA